MANQQTILSTSPPFPRRVVVELTNRCNLSCSMCPRRFMTAPLGDMQPGLFRKVVDEVASHPGTAIAPFFRGEAMLHPDFLGLLEYARRMVSGRIMLFTNCVPMDEPMADSILSLGIDHISFSIDSPDPQTYRDIRRGGDFERLNKNVSYFLGQKMARGLRLPETQVSFVRTRLNSHLVDAFVSKWKGAVDRVRIYEEHSANGRFGSSAEAVSQIDRQPCLKPFSELVVYWNGETALCNHDWDRKESLGSVRDHSIEEIWHGPEYARIRDMHIAGQWEKMTPCSSCTQWHAYYSDNGVVGELLTD